MAAVIELCPSEVCYTDCSNFREKWESSNQMHIFKQTYNSYHDIAMVGINFLYNNKTGNTAMSREQLNNLDRLYNMRQLQNDWNGYGGMRISSHVIDICESIIKRICIQPVIFPTGRSTIQMQYELKDKSYLEFEIFEEKIVCMEVPKRIYENAVFEIITDTDAVGIQKINKIIKEFYEK